MAHQSKAGGQQRVLKMEAEVGKLLLGEHFLNGWCRIEMWPDSGSLHGEEGRRERLKYLDAVAAQAPGEIGYFSAALLKKGDFAEAMQGCSVAFHTASPFTTKVADSQKDLVEPAQLGTRNVLDEANKVESVERVVLTKGGPSLRRIGTKPRGCSISPSPIPS